MTDTERNRVEAICEVAGVSEIEDLSDGFHTFRQLYYQRMMLFAAIVKQNKDKAWKSLRHEDGELCFGGGWFIVGIDTPEGNYTYHYENSYFSLFDCEELECGKHWDGHTEKDVTRLLSLPSAQPEQIARDIATIIENEQGMRVILKNAEHTETDSCDCISREAAIHLIAGYNGVVDKSVAKRLLIQMPSAQPEPSTDIQDVLRYLDDVLHPLVSPDNWNVYSELHDMISRLPSTRPNLGKYEYHYDHTDCIWYRPEARNRCPVTCAQYRDGWNDAMNYIFRDGKGYMPYRRDRQYGE